ncbi:hypothetical protein V9L05_02925 [Bernardetia sp. Wsw4-3y2]
MKFIYSIMSLFILISYDSFGQNITRIEGYTYQVEQNQVTSDTTLCAVKWYDG